MLYAFVILLFIVIMFIFIGREIKKNRIVAAKIVTAKEGGTYEPVSLHPYIDPALCIGSGACVKACPEKDVIGVSGGKGKLINAALCVGHGACVEACPMGAITLVFGTAKRGVEIPACDPWFETNVAGIYLAGELGGMGLVRNAIIQGTEAADNIAASLKEEGPSKETGDPEALDVFIVGAGPAGIGASLNAMKHKLKIVTIDQENFGGTVYNFPVKKIVMTAPVDLPLYGRVDLRETSKENLLELWNKVRADTGLEINSSEKLTGVESDGAGRFKITTSKGDYTTRRLLLCLGRRGTPRKLGVAGEDMAKVSYRLIDPAQHDGEDVLIVGGGDSAVEAAIAIAAIKGNRVKLSYRKDAFGRIKSGNKVRLQETASEHSLEVIFNSNLREIAEGKVKLDVAGELKEFDNDYVYIFAGGELPNTFLKSIGLKVETHHGRPL